MIMSEKVVFQHQLNIDIKNHTVHYTRVQTGHF